jgi:hypothetical protein
MMEVLGVSCVLLEPHQTQVPLFVMIVRLGLSLQMARDVFHVKITHSVQTHDRWGVWLVPMEHFQ